MFEFLSMAGNYDSRKVDRYEEGDLLVSTANVIDSDHPYETAISHPNYNDDDFVIVEEYDEIGDAREGHNKWVKLMTAEKLPETLKDVSTAEVAKLRNDLKEMID